MNCGDLVAHTAIQSHHILNGTVVQFDGLLDLEFGEVAVGALD